MNFIKRYFNREVYQYLWISLPKSDAILLENSIDVPLLRNLYYEFEKDGIPMREYHIDAHPSFVNYIDDNNLAFGGNVSVRNTNRPLIVIGQDESAFSQSITAMLK